MKSSATVSCSLESAIMARLCGKASRRVQSARPGKFLSATSFVITGAVPSSSTPSKLSTVFGDGAFLRRASEVALVLSCVACFFRTHLYIPLVVLRSCLWLLCWYGIQAQYRKMRRSLLFWHLHSVRFSPTLLRGKALDVSRFVILIDKPHSFRAKPCRVSIDSDKRNNSYWLDYLSVLARTGG